MQERIALRICPVANDEALPPPPPAPPAAAGAGARAAARRFCRVSGTRAGAHAIEA
ncbi:MAG: hypothetical protein IPO58_09635 [Betaproteobacteria bacterium]|nr:hypothetical protein [Betaproteobacteria bacterium]